MQFLSSTGMGAATALVTIAAAWRGASVEQVGLLLASFAAAQLASHAVGGHLGDNHGRRTTVQAGLAVATAGAATMCWSTTALGLAWAHALLGAGAGLAAPPLVSLAYDESRRLGRFTAWGSLGHAVGALAATVAAALGGAATSIRPIFGLAAVLYGFAFAASLTMARRPEHRVRVPLFPRTVVARNLPAVSGLLLRHTGATAAGAILPLYLLSLDAPLALIPAIAMVGGVAQFLVMSRVDDRASGTLLVAGLVASGVAFAGMAAAPTPLWVVGAQVLLAGGWSCLYVGVLKTAMDGNAERASATGLIKCTLQTASIAGPLLGGAVAALLGYRAVFVLAALLAVAAVPVMRLQGQHAGDARAIGTTPSPR